MISAVIPCYNAEAYLAEAIESVLTQTRPADEIIVVDDCSTDRSTDIAARYPVKLLCTSVNSGHAAARNVGIEAAQGELIAWLDADDYWDAKHLETVVGLLDRFPTAQVAFSGVRFIGSRQGEWATSPCEHQPRHVLRECFRTTIVPAMSAVTRRAALVSAGGFDPTIRVAPDFDLWLRMSRNHLFVSDPAITSNYRWHPQQISARPIVQFRSTYESRARFLDRTRQAGDIELARDLERDLLALWNHHLAKAWHAGTMDDLHDFLSLAPLIPNSAATARRWKFKALIPAPVVRGAASLLRPLRSARSKPNAP